MDLEYELNLAIEAAKDAGNFLLEQKNNEKLIISEAGRDIKLKLDQDTELLIRNKLKESKYAVFGEEYGGNLIDNEKCWVVDPIDGTSNYFRNIDQCCVSIALLDNFQAKIGVIYNFNSDEMYYSSYKNGAFLNEKKISVSNIARKDKASLTTGFPSSESIESTNNFLGDLTQWKKIRMFGSAALSCAYISSGRCDAYIEKGIYLWDFAAGISLVTEAGGKVEYKKIDEERYSVVMSNGLI